MELQKLEGIIEAILFTMGGAVEISRIARAVEEPGGTDQRGGFLHAEALRRRRPGHQYH